MKSSKRTIRYIANKLNLDPDELLVTLWYFDDRKKFSYLEKVDSIIRQNDLGFVNRIVSIKNIPSDKNINSWMNILGHKDKNQFFLFLEKKFKFYSSRDINEIPESLSLKLLDFLDNQTSSKNKEQQKEKIDMFKGYSFGDASAYPISGFLFLSKDDVLTIHNALVKDFESFHDPIYPPGLKNEAMLESAIFHPKTSYGNVLKYPTVESSAAAIMYSICQNHCFHNGNKRTALVSMLVFLDRHNISIQCDEDELFKMALNLADHKLDVEKISSDIETYIIYKWICSKSKHLIKGERTITFKRLYQILNRFNCDFTENKVERIIIKKSRFFGERKTILKTSIPVVQPGHDVDIVLLKKIRKDLELDCEHNIDTDTFYYDAEYYACEFIEKYKNLLRRLSKF